MNSDAAIANRKIKIRIGHDFGLKKCAMRWQQFSAITPAIVLNVPANWKGGEKGGLNPFCEKWRGKGAPQI
jgi:hypothetical protein